MRFVFFAVGTDHTPFMYSRIAFVANGTNHTRKLASTGLDTSIVPKAFRIYNAAPPVPASNAPTPIFLNDSESNENAFCIDLMMI